MKLSRPLTLTALAAACSVGGLAVQVPAQGAFIATYGFDSDSLAATFVGPNVTATPITPGVSATTNTLSFTNSGGGSNGGPTGQFASGASRMLVFSNTDYEEFRDPALAAGQFVALTLTADSGFSLDLSQLTFGHARSNSAPRQIAVYTKSFAEANFTHRGSFGNSGTSTIDSNDYFTVNLTGLADTSTIDFRFVFFDDNIGPGVGYLENIAIEGEASVIPEPASLALIGLGSLLMLPRRRSN